jgi:predicted GIY-YIG superfamily endonuclease
MYVYLILSTCGKTYVGATVDLQRRLKQHNGVLKGGAKYTTSKVQQGQTWTRVCHLSGFKDWRSCLRFEWRWKMYSRKLKGSPLTKRLEALNIMLAYWADKDQPLEVHENLIA